MKKNRSNHCYHIAGLDKMVHTISKGISPKVNAIIRLESELAHYDVAIPVVRHYSQYENRYQFLSTEYDKHEIYIPINLNKFGNRDNYLQMNWASVYR